MLLLMAVGIATNAFNFLQTAVPGLHEHAPEQVRGLVEHPPATERAEGRRRAREASRVAHTCPAASPALVTCGLAPNFTDVTKWLNTPGGQPLTIEGPPGQGGVGRLLDVLVHQLPALAAARRGVVQALRGLRTRGRRACTRRSSPSSTS